MAAGKFFSWLFEREDDKDNADDFKQVYSVAPQEMVGASEEGQNQTSEPVTMQTTGTKLHDVLNFIVELQSYYYNDICKMQTDVALKADLTQAEVNFIDKKIKQDQIALAHIEKILKLIEEKEREYRTVWRKSGYSFYDEIEKVKLAKVQVDVFLIFVRLCLINTKQELESVILKRIEECRTAWNIDKSIKIPENYNLILVDGKDNVETYRFGKFTKKVWTAKNEKALSLKQLDDIRQLSIQFESEIPTNEVWVYVSGVTRLQLNFMRRTCFIKKEWEYDPENEWELYLDVVKVADLESYIKGLLQLILARNTYAVISIVVPTNEMLGIIGKTEKEGERVKICNKLGFLIKQRSGKYRDNLLTVRIDRRNIPEELEFVSYLKFKKMYF